MNGKTSWGSANLMRNNLNGQHNCWYSLFDGELVAFADPQPSISVSAWIYGIIVQLIGAGLLVAGIFFLVFQINQSYNAYKDLTQPTNPILSLVYDDVELGRLHSHDEKDDQKDEVFHQHKAYSPVGLAYDQLVFLRKVYLILLSQLILTVGISSIALFIRSMNRFLQVKKKSKSKFLFT